MTQAMILVPRTPIRAGDIVTVKAMVSHPMETGYRRAENGAEIPRNIIRRISCRYDGVEVMAVDLHPAIAANPFIACSLVATKTGPVEFEWIGDNGFRHRQSAELVVAG